MVVGKFTSYEISPVTEHHGYCQAHSTIEEARENALYCADFVRIIWSLYGRADREAEHIADRVTFADAATLYAQITGNNPPLYTGGRRILPA